MHAADRRRVFAAARRLKLWEHDQWHRLVHYQPTPFGGKKSEVDDPQFFLAEGGHRDPKAELLATLSAALKPSRGEEDAHAVCRFPARIAWLRARIPSLSVPELTCPKRQRFVSRLDAGSLSIVFAANSIKHPASALGHSFLLVEPGAKKAGTTIDYRAKSDTNNPLLYGFKGLTGLFAGRFEFVPENRKLVKISVGQGRDLWQIELDLAEAELERFVLHLWELQRVRIDYFYLTENCSYHALAALEAAVPRLHLLEHTKFVVMPVDTVHALFAQPGLVKNVAYIPASRTERGTGDRVETNDEKPRFRRRRPPLLRRIQESHGPMRFTLGSGITSAQGPFYTVGYRLAFHDLLDPPIGAPELLQIQALGIEARYAPDVDSFTVDEVTFVEFMTINPLNFGSPLAWRARAFGKRVRDPSCPGTHDCFVHGLDVGLGTSVATANRAFSVFVLASTSLTFSDSILGIRGSAVRWTVGPWGGMRVRLAPRMVTLWTARWNYLPWQQIDSSFDFHVAWRWGLARNVAVGLEGRVQPSAYEAGLRSYLYF